MSIHGAHSLLIGYKHFPSISLGHSLTFGEKTDILFLSLRPRRVISPVIDEIQISGVRLLKRLKRTSSTSLNMWVATCFLCAQQEECSQVICPWMVRFATPRARANYAPWPSRGGLHCCRRGRLACGGARRSPREPGVSYRERATSSLFLFARTGESLTERRNLSVFGYVSRRHAGRRNESNPFIVSLPRELLFAAHTMGHSNVDRGFV